MGRPSNFERQLTEAANKAHEEFLERLSFENRIKSRTIKIKSQKQLPDIFTGAQWGNDINNKELEKRTGKDKSHISKLLSSGRMNLKTFLELCKALDLEVYIKGTIYKREW